MAGKRRQEATGALREIGGIVLMTLSFLTVAIALYNLAGIWAGVIPGALALTWVGYNIASRNAPPHATPGEPRPVLPEYRDPDAGLPVGLYERDPVPVERDSERD